MSLSERPLLSDRQLRERVIELVQSTQKHIPDNSSIADIANSFSLQVCEDRLPMDKDGAYIENESKIIINNLVTSEERRLFTFYHEIVHYLIREDEDLYSYLHDAYKGSENFDKTIELICNIGAAEFILPQANVREFIEKKGFSLELVPQLCQQGCVSGPAAMIQLIQCASHHCYGIICEFGIPPIIGNNYQFLCLSPMQSSSLYILYAMWSPSAKYTIARFTTIPKDHFLAQPFSKEELIRGTDRIPFRSGADWSVPCQAIHFRNNVYGLFNVEPPLSNQQPRLF
jgi:Zn-dependent peptidase ImmA (M78 family)